MLHLAYLAPDDVRWRTFALAYATTPLQHPAWLDTLTHAYNLEARVAALIESNDIIAALPMVKGKLLRRQRIWKALPFTDTLAPVVVADSFRDDLMRAIVDESDRQQLLVHSSVQTPGWFCKEVGTIQIIDLSKGVAGVLRRADAKTRRNVKRAERPEIGLSARPITQRAEFMGPHLTLIAASRRRLGVPTQPTRYWSHIWKLHEHGEALTIGVHLSNRLIATGVFLLGSRHAVYKYSASDAVTWKLRPNYLMLATAFDLISARGITSLDFGVTDRHNASLREFKERWGGEQREVHYSATQQSLLPATLEPSRPVAYIIQHTPAIMGKGLGAAAYRFAA